MEWVEKIPINWGIIRNPINWIIVLLMVVIAAMGAETIAQYISNKKGSV